MTITINKEIIDYVIAALPIAALLCFILRRSKKILPFLMQKIVIELSFILICMAAGIYSVHTFASKYWQGPDLFLAMMASIVLELAIFCVICLVKGIEEEGE